MKIVHLIAGLDKGGAETMLFNICKYKKDPIIHYEIVTLGKGSFYENSLKELGVTITKINLLGNPYLLLVNFKKILEECDVLCCWMYHCNFFGYFLSKFFKVPKIIWNIRHSNISRQYDKITTVFINKICTLFSGQIDMILYNGYLAKRNHEHLGYYPLKSKVVPNGCDTTIYKKSFNDNIIKINNPKKQLILSVARYEVIKDFPNFISSFAIAKKSCPNIQAIMCGKNVDDTNIELVQLIIKNNLTIGEDILLLGERNDLPFIYSISDLYVLHSASEAFPNTLLEAMSCECVCITTDVGEVSKIISTDTLLIPPNNSIALAAKIVQMLRLSIEERIQLGKRNRNIVFQKYSIDSIVEIYESIFRDVCI